MSLMNKQQRNKIFVVNELEQTSRRNDIREDSYYWSEDNDNFLNLYDN